MGQYFKLIGYKHQIKNLFSAKKSIRNMKLIALVALCGALVTAKQPKCEKTPKGGIRRYNTPRTIERGDNNPAAIEFLLDNRADLLSIFAAGENPELLQTVSENLGDLNTFAHAVGDQFMGQIFRVTRQIIVNMVHDGEFQVHKEFGEDMAKLYRDNTQRITRGLRDIVFSQTILDQLKNGQDITAELYNINALDFSEGHKVQKAFMDNHLEKLMPVLKMMSSKFAEIHSETALQVSKIIKDEKQKSSYRRLINELPQVYQFFNDNIDYVELNNVDKDLEEAIAAEILHEIARQNDNSQIVSMINRHKKFIKKIMMDRTMEQQKRKPLVKLLKRTLSLKKLLIMKLNSKDFWKRLKLKVKKLLMLCENKSGKTSSIARKIPKKKKSKTNKNKDKKVLPLLDMNTSLVLWVLCQMNSKKL